MTTESAQNLRNPFPPPETDRDRGRVSNPAMLAERQQSGKELLRARAVQLRHAAEQLDTLAGTLPETLTDQQDYALRYFLQSTNIVA